ncbi:MAG: hypothetical protein WAR76_01885, partial [Xanthobacteraceae bacterium]
LIAARGRRWRAYPATPFRHSHACSNRTKVPSAHVERGTLNEAMALSNVRPSIELGFEFGGD